MKQEFEKSIERIYIELFNSSYSRYDFVDISLSMATLIWLSDHDILPIHPPGEEFMFDMVIRDSERRDTRFAFEQAIDQWERENPQRLGGLLRIDRGGWKDMTIERWNALCRRWKDFFDRNADGSTNVILAVFDSLQSFLTPLTNVGNMGTPKDVVNLILHTIDISPRSTVYDPYCRTGDFLLAAAQKAKELTGISGVTNTGLPRKFAGLRLLIQTASLSQSISKGLILTNYHNEEKFDYVIANPPFGSLSNPIQTVHQSGRWSTLAQHSERTDVILFGHCMDHLKTDGQMAIIVPNVFLSGKGIFKEIRRRLVEEYLLEAVVTLPARIFTGTGVSAAILFINKRGNKNDFFLLDAARMGIKKGNTVCLDMTRIMELIEIGKKRNTTADERLRIVSRQEAIDHDYDLQFSTYGTEEAFFPDNLVPSSQLLQECKAIEQELEQVRIRLNELMTGKPQ